jgi:hypothetical protein
MGAKPSIHHISSSTSFPHNSLLVSWHFDDFRNFGLLIRIYHLITCKVLFGAHFLEKYLSVITRSNWVKISTGYDDEKRLLMVGEIIEAN